MKIVLRLALLAAPVLALSCSGSADPRVEIRIDTPAGAVLRKELVSTITGGLAIRAEGKEERQSLIKDERRVVDDEVLSAEGGRVTRLRRTTVEWTMRRQGPGEPAPVDVAFKLPGKTIVLTRTDLGTQIDGAAGVPAEELRLNKIDALEALLSVPDGSVKIGDSWPVNEDHLISVFGDEGVRGVKVREASGTGRLDRIETWDDDARIAVVTLSVEARGGLRQLLDVDVTLKLLGTFFIDTTARRPVAFEIRGTGDLSGEVDRAKGPAVYEGSFTFNIVGKSTPK
jgi:hypothetical protein